MSALDDFKSKYKDGCKSTLYNLYIKEAKLGSLNRINAKLESVVASSIKGELDNTDDIWGYPYYDIHEFLFLVLFVASNKLLGVDSERLAALEFGYKNCTDVLQSFYQITNRNLNTDETYARLLSIGRDISYNDYISGELYVKDLDNVLDLLDVTPRSINANSDELKNAIDERFGKNVDSALNIIRSRYDYILEGTFGIDNYVGVYTGTDVPAMLGVVSSVAKPIEPAIKFKTDFHPILSDIVEMKSYNGSKTGRQFDLTDILSNYNNKSQTPLYFPYKVLEIISKSGLLSNDGSSYTFTSKTQLLNYTKLPERVIGTKDKYLDVITKYFRGSLSEFIYKCLIWYCQTNLLEKYPVFGKTGNSADENKKLKSEVEETIVDIMESMDSDYDSMRDYVISAMSYYVDCVSTAVVLDKCETAKSGSRLDILEFRIKVCARLKDKAYTNEKFIQSYIAQAGLNISDMPGVESSSAKTDDNNFSMIDLKYTFDSDKVNARPTFAYKALESLNNQLSDEERQRGVVPVSWQNILLGRNLSDRILTSGSSGEINMQKNQVHWVFSGSRSGKGVMCYNIFSTAIGGKIPIFYIDRKPDTATVMSELCPEMFCVNGGQYDAKIDTKGIFNPDSYNFEIPDYLKTYFTSTELKCDFMYFRSVMLVLSMFDYADTYKESPLGADLQSAFGGGVLLVLDEFSNFINNFLARTKPMSCSSGSWLSKAYSQGGMEKKLKEVSDGVVKAETALAKAQSKKDASEKEINIAQENLDAANSKEFELDRVYWAAVADAYKFIQDSLAGKKDAAGAVAKSMQIFVIGQNLDKVEESIALPDWFNTGAAGNMLKFNKSDGIIPLIHLLGGLSSDIITGYQVDRQSYLAQGDSKFKTKSMLNQSRRCFAYKKFESFTQAEINKVSHTASALKDNENAIRGYLNSWTYFKPFLILNNSIEPPECVRSKDFAPTSEKRLNIRKGNEKLDSMSDAEQQLCMQSQFVGQCLSSCEDAGLTWEDLLSDNDDGSGHLNTGVGFEGYISQLANGIPVDSMALSGQLANRFIHEVYGYPSDKTWRDFVCDFRPEWIVSTKGYTADGTSSIIQDKLSDSYFSKPLLSLNIAKKLGDKLGTLLPYYEGTNIATENTESTINTDIYGDEDDGLIEQCSGVVGNDSIPPHKSFTDEERREFAEFAADIIIGVLSKQSNRNLDSVKPNFVNMLISLLVQKGY